MSFSEYITPDPSASVQYFASLTVADARRIIQNQLLPKILPENSINRWLYDGTQATTASEIGLVVGEPIPCLQDLLPIMQPNFGDTTSQNCIWLIINVNNQAYNLQSAVSLLDRIVTSALLLPPLIAELKENKFMEPLAGFHITKAPLYTLGCLLNEHWAMEDVLNAREELAYFRCAAMFLGEEPSFLFIPTSFINDYRKLLESPITQYSPNIVAMRERWLSAS
ncbi:hypothetical protein C8J57DRAFT_1533292 [Mycena rebaudengoi]|nr:hypothetical protein C8J57DRAFT_1533292 [Mycena rebaudengoi]